MLFRLYVFQFFLSLFLIFVFCYHSISCCGLAIYFLSFNHFVLFLPYVCLSLFLSLDLLLYFVCLSFLFHDRLTLLWQLSFLFSCLTFLWLLSFKAHLQIRLPNAFSALHCDFYYFPRLSKTKVSYKKLQRSVVNACGNQMCKLSFMYVCLLLGLFDLSFFCSECETKSI